MLEFPHGFCCLKLAASLALIVAFVCGAVAQASPDSKVVKWSECDASYVSGARCGTFRVPLDYGHSKSGTLELFFVVLRAKEGPAAIDPIFYISGGPGQSTSELAKAVPRFMQSVNSDRDVVLLDQRGTGKSYPLECASNVAGQTQLQYLLGDLFPVDWVKACYSRLQVRPEFFTTAIAMQDLHNLSAALGYKQFDLYGTSYGTRAVFSYLRQFPGDGVRTAVLKSPVPMNLVIAQDFAADAQRSLDLLFTRCSADPKCNDEFPSVKSEFRKILDNLDRESAKTKVLNPSTSKPEQVALDRALIATLVRSILYRPQAAAKLPLMIHRAYLGDWGPFAEEAIAVRSDIERDAAGLYLSIVCSEDFPFIDQKQVKSRSQETFLGVYWYLQLRQGCRFWHVKSVKKSFRDLVSSSVPVLLITGSMDPTTPPPYTDATMKYLPHALHVNFENGSHAFNSGDCELAIIKEFVEKGSGKEIDTSCAARVDFPEFARN